MRNKFNVFFIKKGVEIDHAKNRPAFFDWRYFLSILSVAFFLFSANVSIAQNISLRIKDGTLEQAFESIEKQTDYSFWYYKNQIAKGKKVNVSVDKVTLRSALDLLFSDQPFTYKIVDKTIAVTYKEPVKKTAQRDAAPVIQNYRTISGIVFDIDATPLKGATIRLIGTDNKVSSGEGGKFNMQVPSGVDSLEITCLGYDSSVIKITDKESIRVQLDRVPITLANAEVSVQMNRVDPTRYLSLKNRNYMNLGQVLQGTIPGLTLQVINTSSTEVVAVDKYHFRSGSNTGGTYIRMSVEEFLNSEGRIQGQQIIDALLSGRSVSAPGTVPPYVLVTAVKTKATIAPQVRGANSYTGNLSNVLIVIDGFPQEEFQADYPMTNVESIEVIKDPKELIKWGSKGSGGVILIRTKTPAKGRININYATNMYYSSAPKFSWEGLQLAATPDYLDYTREQYEVFNPSWNQNSMNLTPAQTLLMQKRENIITEEQFNSKWDSLGAINNEGQLALLQQETFSHNHTLNMDGGTQNYRFSLTGTYLDNRTSDLGSRSQSGMISLRNNFNAFNNKLNIKWLVDYSVGKVKSGYNLNPNVQLEPYQLLVDPRTGNYIYNNTVLSAGMNDKIMDAGYKNHGSNILEDARINDFTTRNNQKQTRFDLSWDFLPELKLKTSVYYLNKKTDTKNIYNQSSTFVRQLVNSYGELTPNGVNFYVPNGDIMSGSGRDYMELNLRSGLSYSKNWGKHTVGLTAGAGAGATEWKQPAMGNTYGYNRNTNTGAPVYLPAGNSNASISNFYSLINGTNSFSFPYLLLNKTGGDTTITRNININGSLNYEYGDRFSFGGSVSNVYSPLYGRDKNYSVMSQYEGSATGAIIADPFAVVSNLSLTTGVDVMKLPDMPVAYNNIRYLQGGWGDYAIWVKSISPTQQKGQNTTNYYQKATLGLWQDQLTLDVSFNSRRLQGSTTAYINSEDDVALDTTIHYLGAGINGQFRKKLLNFNLKYDKSPEGKTQWNGFFNYEIGEEDYFQSEVISRLSIDGRLQNISPYQGLGIMMGTNVAGSNGFGLGTTSDFSTLPPSNTNWELHAKMGMYDDRYQIDLRYYNTKSAGLNNYVPSYTDPSTGLESRTTYSTIVNKGIEFFLKTTVLKREKLEYSLTLNGAYNVNIAKDVPSIAFTANSSYLNAYREGYNINGLWGYRWAGLNEEGDPQIYNAAGEITSVLDSATLASSIVYSGPSRAPWTGGFIQDLSWGNFFARAAVNFSWKYMVRRYIPGMSNPNVTERSILIRDRWREAGDENRTDIAALKIDDGGGYRSFVIQNSTNSLVTGDHIRLQEIMVGWASPESFARRLGVKRFTASVQVQNVAIWTRNDMDVDPITIVGNGVTFPVPRQYSLTLNVGF